MNIFDPRDWFLRPEQIKTQPNVNTGSEDRWLECRPAGEKKPDEHYGQLKGFFMPMPQGPLNKIGAVIVQPEKILLRLDPATPEEEQEFNNWVQEQLSEESKIENERRYLIDQLTGLGTLLMRAADLLGWDGQQGEKKDG